MVKGTIDFERKSDHLVIPEAYIIDQLIDLNEPQEEAGLRLPQNYPVEEDPPKIESSKVIIIEL